MKMKRLKKKFSLSMSWKHVGGVEVQLHLLLTLTLDGGGWLISHRGRLTAGKKTPVPIEEKAKWAPEPVGTI